MSETGTSLPFTAFYVTSLSGICLISDPKQVTLLNKGLLLGFSTQSRNLM